MNHGMKDERPPGNSAGDLFGMVGSCDPNLEVLNVTNPTFGGPLGHFAVPSSWQ